MIVSGNTFDVIKTLLKNDSIVSDDSRRWILSALCGEVGDMLADVRPIDRVLKRKAVAKLLGCTVRTVSDYAKRGLIRPVKFGKAGSRSVGFSEGSVRELLEKGARCGM